ncbi:claudin-18 isoform X2 [Xiphias gladius]|uniref:claudin-18 isoform X2 n=1 Tax=Xiphias gladius TaxID=8245 RepID=UPI001A9859CB|nr:claudin-18 isoform X2 [Xiphias gladius]
MAPSVLQNGGFILGLIGAAALIAATAMNNWSVKDRQGEVVTSVYTYKGLWQDCETASSGFTECRPLYGILGFSGAFQAVRALMIVGVVLSVLGAVMSVFSLTCLTMNSMEDTTKAKMSLTAGIMFVVAGMGRKENLTFRCVWDCRRFYLRQSDRGQFQDVNLLQLRRRRNDGGRDGDGDGWRSRRRSGRNAQIHIWPCTVHSLDRRWRPDYWWHPEVSGFQGNGER